MVSNPTSKLVLNIAPLSFSSTKLTVGRVAYTTPDAYSKLRETHRNTHVFRFDSRSGDIFNVSLARDADPVGMAEEVEIGEHLLLVAKAVQQSILMWLGGKRPILKGPKDLVFWGQTNDAQLVRQACKTTGVDFIPGLEVRLRYEVDCRLFWDREDHPYLGVVIDVDTTNVIDIPVSQLVDAGMSVLGCGVCKRKEMDHPYLYPTLDRLGRVSSIANGMLFLTDTSGVTRVKADSALLEPRLENLQRAIRILYGAKAEIVLGALEQLRQPVSTSAGKLARIDKTLAGLKGHHISIADGVEVKFGELLRESHALFPERVATDRPTLLFGPQGRNTGPYPDVGIRTWGPYMYMQHTRNAPLVGILCEAQHRGRVEQFAAALCNGFPDESWKNTRTQNPYRGGLIGKFRLSKIRLEYEECSGSTAQEYQSAARKLLQRLPDPPDLVIVQTREAFVNLPSRDNPYYISKAAFMSAGVPTQSIEIENIDISRPEAAYLLNSIAVATYAKLDGIPWVISTPGSTTHELVLGIGSTEVEDESGSRTRYVGITTLFQGDGRYLVWGLTREVEYEEYAEALLESLRAVIRHMQNQNGWELGDRVRLVCHVYKRLKNCEVDAVKSLVRQLVADQFQVEFAFLDVSWAHPYHLFDPSQKGKRYWAGTQSLVRGAGFPERGIGIQLDRYRALLHLTGPNDVKTEGQGLPKPLLVELHPDSDFTDLTYLVRQIYHFTYISWRSFQPATEPVTIKYSHRIASVLGNLKNVPGWSSTVIAVGSLRGRLWFL